MGINYEKEERLKGTLRKKGPRNRKKLILKPILLRTQEKPRRSSSLSSMFCYSSKKGLSQTESCNHMILPLGKLLLLISLETKTKKWLLFVLASLLSTSWMNGLHNFQKPFCLSLFISCSDKSSRGPHDICISIIGFPILEQPCKSSNDNVYTLVAKVTMQMKIDWGNISILVLHKWLLRERWD